MVSGGGTVGYGYGPLSMSVPIRKVSIAPDLACTAGYFNSGRGKACKNEVHILFLRPSYIKRSVCLTCMTWSFAIRCGADAHTGN